MYEGRTGSSQEPTAEDVIGKDTAGAALTELVTVVAEVFSTPRITIHMCLDGMMLFGERNMEIHARSFDDDSNALRFENVVDGECNLLC